MASAGFVTPTCLVQSSSTRSGVSSESAVIRSQSSKRSVGRKHGYVSSFLGSSDVSTRSFHGRTVSFSSKISGSNLIQEISMVATVETGLSGLLSEKLRQEIENEEKVAGFTHSDFSEMLDKFDYSFRVGDTVKGVVFSIEGRGALIDIGAKAAAFLPMAEIDIEKVERAEDFLAEGEQKEFAIIKGENEDGQLTLSLRRIQYKNAWEAIRKAQVEDSTVEAEVLAVNRGGVIARVQHLRGFIPSSHLSVSTNSELVGQTLPCKFLEVDEEKNRLILSHRRAVVEKQMVFLEVGQVAVGVVKNIKPYGAFIDIGGISGLLHISQISQDHIDNVGAVLENEEKIKVMVIHHDSERGRISLSTKHLEPEGGDMIKNRQAVWDRAEEMGEKYRLAQEAKLEAKALQAAQDLQSLDELMPEAAPATTVDEDFLIE